MADAFIYYRLQSNDTDTHASNPLYPDPKVVSGSVTNRNTFVTNMEANHSAQILRFTLPDELLESVTMDYENNIKDAPVSEPNGTRRINKQDNGLSYIRYTFRGRFKDSATDITSLINMSKRLQVESTTDSDALGFGIFGFFTDNTTIAPFNLDPISTKGLTIKSINISRSGQQPKNFDFTIVMTFGGTY
jgi:hypothetical protein